MKVAENEKREGEGKQGQGEVEGKEERLVGDWSLHKSRDKIYVRGVNNHEFFCAITLEETSV